MDSDDVIDYMVMEAVATKAVKEQKDAQDQEKQAAWKKDDEGLKNLKNIAGG